MNNKLSDLNNHLFLQIERLGDESIQGEKLDAEIQRAKAIVGVSEQIIEGARVTLDVLSLIGKGHIDRSVVPNMLLENKK